MGGRDAARARTVLELEVFKMDPASNAVPLEMVTGPLFIER